MLLCLTKFTLSAADAPKTDVKFVPWDGRESIAEYVRRVQIEQALTFELGDGVKLECVAFGVGLCETALLIFPACRLRCSTGTCVTHPHSADRES